ncbi:hypothetical protein ABZ825_40895 [Streptomyces tauricus]|uniref:hypothetical protein n=1 Tax=Streptomyces tauricus TaxID=68274 RepID=UPI003404C776
MRQVYIRLPDGHLHEIPWIHRDHVHAPMSETVWRHIRTTLNRRGDREHHEAALAEAADQVLRRARPATPAHAAPPRTTPGTHTTKATPQEAGHQAAVGRYTAEAEDSLDALEARAQAEAHDAGADEPGAHPLPESGALTLYDADQEAELW